jgi:AcrR family transcriptional regulator
MAVTTPTSHGVRLPRAEREQQLLDVAEELFTTRGYADTSLEDIARGAGVTRPVIYDLHGNKEAVFLACVHRRRTELQQEIVAAAASTTDPRERLIRGTDAYYRLLETDPRRWELLFGPAGPAVGTLAAALTAQRFRTVQFIADVLQVHAPHIPRERLELYAHAVSGSSEQVGRWWLTQPHLPREHVVEQLVDLIWAGLERLALSPPPDAVGK